MNCLILLSTFSLRPIQYCRSNAPSMPYALLEVVLEPTMSESLSSTEPTSLPYSTSPTTFTAGLRSLHLNRQSELCNESLILLHSFTIQLRALILQLSGCRRLGPRQLAFLRVSNLPPTCPYKALYSFTAFIRIFQLYFTSVLNPAVYDSPTPQSHRSSGYAFCDKISLGSLVFEWFLPLILFRD